MSYTGAFEGLTLAHLQTIQSDYVACLHAISVAGQNYSIGGRSFSRANLAEVKSTLLEVNTALKKLIGARTRTVYTQVRYP